MNPDNPFLRYKIRKKIGTGGMASVFLASDTVLHRDVALKMVHPHLLHHSETIRRFSNEARAVAALSHENIIKIFDFGEARSRPFIVMEYIDGITLEDLIAREGTIPNVVTMEIALQVLSGLVCAHEKGIYHRDIKPGNILIDAHGRVCITDFGIAYLVNAESVTLTGSFLGSPHYISPEQVSNKTVGANTDVFSLGVVLYQCLTGSVPFNADTPHGVIHQILTAVPPGLCMKNAHVLLWFADLVESCLVKEASKRPESKELSSRIVSACRSEAIRTGSDRIVAFVNNPAAARTAEMQEIVTLYREKAIAALKRRQTAAVLRAFEQASRFGALSAADRKLIQRTARHSAIRRGLHISGSVVIGAAILFYIGSIISNRVSRPPLVPVTPAALQPIDTAVREENTAPSNRTGQSFPAFTIDDTGADASTKAAAEIGHEHITIETNASLAPDSPRPETTSPPVTDSTPFPATGFFKCFTNPPWVTIYIDNIERGTTPTLSAIPLLSGRHMLRLVKKGFPVFDSAVTIIPAETTLVRIRLTPER